MRLIRSRLAEVRTLLSLAERGRSCAEVKTLAEGHIESIRAKIADLSRMEAALATTVARCAGGADPECPILESLIGDDTQAR